MKKLTTILTLWMILWAAPALCMDAFPDLELQGTLSPEWAAQLGAGDSPVKVSAIKADYLLVEVFSLYCPICQRDAPGVNKVVQAVKDSEFGESVRVIGIGAGNTPFEVDFYAKKYQAGFPLFHDEDFVAHKALNNVGTPAFYLVDLKAGRKVLYFHEGEMGEPDAMSAALLKALRENGGR